MYLKGEYVMEKATLVIKRATLVKIFKLSKFLAQYDTIGFEILINKEFGNNKHSFNIEDINRLIVLVSQTYFPREYLENAKHIIMKILEICILPYVYGLLIEPKSSLATFLNSNSRASILNYSISRRL
jgi:hypothetical protein